MAEIICPLGDRVLRVTKIAAEIKFASNLIHKIAPTDQVGFRMQPALAMYVDGG